MKKKILIKAILVHPNKKGFVPGVGRSNVELINALLAINDPALEFSCYCIGINSLRRPPYNWPIRYYSLPIIGRYRYYFDKWLEPFFRKFCVGYNLLHLTGNYDGVWSNENYVLTIHDLIEYNKYPKTRMRFQKCSKYAKAIFTCSEYSKKEITSILGIPENKVHVVYWGLNHKIFYKRSETSVKAVLKYYKITTPYFFSCLGVDPTNRKNTDITMAALRKLLDTCTNITLVLTWTACPDYLMHEYAKEMKEGKIMLLKGVNDEDLACLYSGALASYFISSAEGFGFPILESFACGTPCVTCRNTSLTEIGSDKAYFVNERDVDDTLESMIHFVREGKGDTSSLIDYAKSYTWEATACKYVEIYKRILGL